MDFNGFPKETFDFLKGLEKNNNKTWFDAHKQEYQDYYLSEAQAFVEVLGARLKKAYPKINAIPDASKGSLMRIYRDVRFSNDKTPYKPHLAVVFWEGAGKKTENPGFYFHMDKKEAVIYGGNHMFTKAFLPAYRQALEDEKNAAALRRAIQAVEKAGDYEIGGDQYKRVPKPFDEEYKFAELTKYKGIWVKTPTIPIKTLQSKQLVDVCYNYCKDIAPLHKWMMKINETI